MVLDQLLTLRWLLDGGLKSGQHLLQEGGIVHEHQGHAGAVHHISECHYNVGEDISCFAGFGDGRQFLDVPKRVLLMGMVGGVVAQYDEGFFLGGGGWALVEEVEEAEEHGVFKMGVQMVCL